MARSVLEEVVTGSGPGYLPLSVDQYHRMLESGILRDGERVELIDGLLVRRGGESEGMVHGARHAMVVARLQQIDRALAGRNVHLRSQLPLTLAPASEPEPDAALICGLPQAFADRHPGPAEVLAVIEVADATLGYDRVTKLALYARAGIPQYLIVNLVEGVVEVHEQPVPAEARYRERSVLRREVTVRVALGAEGSVELPVSELLPSLRA